MVFAKDFLCLEASSEKGVCNNEWRILMTAFRLGVCSWSLQVTSVPELQRLMQDLAINIVQMACGDPHHASWDEGDDMPKAATEAGLQMSSAMIGFPGESYETLETIKHTGGFGDPQHREKRLEILGWALERTQKLGLNSLTLHAGFIPHLGDPGRSSFLDTLGQASALAQEKNITLAFETGQETAVLMNETLMDLRCRNLGVNYDPANMLLYGMGDPVVGVHQLAPWIKSVHAKDAIESTVKGRWGQEVPLGKGQVNFPKFLNALREIGYKGPLCIEREVGTQSERLEDIRAGARFLHEIMA